MLQQKNESVKFKNFIKEVRNDNKRHNYCYERYSPVALPLPICHRIMKKPAYKHEVFRQDAVLAADRRSNREIAEALYLSEGSVKQYLNRIYAKLHIEGDTRTKRQQLAQLFCKT